MKRLSSIAVTGFISMGLFIMANLQNAMGGTWSPVGQLIHCDCGPVIGPSGSLYAAVNADETAVCIKWSGSQWDSVGQFANYGQVESMISGISGNLYVAGQFEYVGGIAAHDIAKWNGTSWSALGSDSVGGMAIAYDGIGNIYVGGGYMPYVRKWNGSSWSILTGSEGAIFALACDGSGNLYAGGQLSYPGGGLAWDIAR